ncbi:MAG: hypothetical protein BJ554DRAFT_4106 [Olpidium bornovanus]|uniref:Uncharacterized protein n=1 Tax=Olpidium bornovanus TaxID=278681 RepID=A0A8H7ZNM3_9FUNG|nr:MAG: hypothetical protein BJ554DRAFT_4106 [Olpidium bornovanus]
MKTGETAKGRGRKCGGGKVYDNRFFSFVVLLVLLRIALQLAYRKPEKFDLPPELFHFRLPGLRLRSALCPSVGRDRFRDCRGAISAGSVAVIAELLPADPAQGAIARRPGRTVGAGRGHGREGPQGATALEECAAHAPERGAWKASGEVWPAKKVGTGAQGFLVRVA